MGNRISMAAPFKRATWVRRCPGSATVSPSNYTWARELSNHETSGSLDRPFRKVKFAESATTMGISAPAVLTREVEDAVLSEIFFECEDPGPVRLARRVGLPS
jgi:hypothetical protein